MTDFENYTVIDGSRRFWPGPAIPDDVKRVELVDPSVKERVQFSSIKELYAVLHFQNPWWTKHHVYDASSNRLPKSIVKNLNGRYLRKL